MALQRITGNTWLASGQFVTTGTDTFDAGSINVFYE